MIRDYLIRMATQVVERGLVPDRVTRLVMRRLCEKRLVDDPEQRRQELAAFIEAAHRAPVAPVPEKANDQHYEVPAAFFEQVLGRHRKYSCCYWEHADSSLDDAEEASLRISSERAELEDGMRVLELGCGWGSLTLFLAQHLPNCRLTAVSNSRSQREFIESEARRRGVDQNLTVVSADMNQFAPAESFDRIVSIEMFEHMRNHHELLRRIAGWLDPGGKLFVHLFCHRQQAYEFHDSSATDWMSRYFFTGGIMPSEDLLGRYDDHMRIAKQWRWNGTHYQRTADAWIDRIDANRDNLMPILRRVYGERDARLWLQRWRMLFMAGSELFGYDHGRQWYVAHYLMEPVAAARVQPASV